MIRSLVSTLAAALLLALGAAPAIAQDKLYRSVDAVAGTAVRLGVYATVSKECTLGALPEVKVATPPKHGSLAVKHGKMKAGTLARCPKLEIPAQGVFYQANANYTGSDEVAYEVKHPDGRTQSFSVNITVAKQAKPGSKKEPGVDL